MIIIIYTASIRTKTNTYQSQQSHNRVQPQGDIHGEEKQVTKPLQSVCINPVNYSVALQEVQNVST